MIDNLTGLNFTLTGMFVLFIAGHILSTILFVKKQTYKKKKPYKIHLASISRSGLHK